VGVAVVASTGVAVFVGRGVAVSVAAESPTESNALQLVVTIRIKETAQKRENLWFIVCLSFFSLVVGRLILIYN
jgi:hypothetical protein